MAAYSSNVRNGDPQSGRYATGDTFTDASGYVYECVKGGYPGTWTPVSKSLAPIDVTASTLTVTRGAHDGRTITLNRALGITATLPAATGSGSKFRFVVGTAASGGTGYIVKVANASDTMKGVAVQAQDAGDTAVAFEASGTADTVTMNGTTTGGLVGDVIEIEDVATNVFNVRVISTGTGTEATPFSATV